MNEKNNEIVMNLNADSDLPEQPTTVEGVRQDRKEKLASAFRIFGKFGFDEGVAGHITARDPEDENHFWVNPMGKSFKQICVSDLLKVDHEGNVLEGEGLLNGAAFTIHSHIHRARPDVIAAAHSHSVYGKAFSALGKTLLPITQDACAFYKDHVLFDDYTGVVLEASEGERLASALGNNKAAILRNHGLITVGGSVEEAAWWYITMERSCQAQLLAQAAGELVCIEDEHAANTYDVVGSALAGWFSFLSLHQVITQEQPDLFD